MPTDIVSNSRPRRLSIHFVLVLTTVSTSIATSPLQAQTRKIEVGNPTTKSLPASRPRSRFRTSGSIGRSRSLSR